MLTGIRYRIYNILQVYYKRQMYLKEDAEKIHQSPFNKGVTLKGYGFCNEEMLYLDMPRRDYENYLKLRYLVFRIASNELMRLYFPRIISRIEELARSQNFARSFLFFVKSLHYMKEEISENLHLA